jgi:hypothetical protein
MGRTDGRQWGLSVAAYGEIPMAAVTEVRGQLAEAFVLARDDAGAK